MACPVLAQRDRVDLVIRNIAETRLAVTDFVARATPTQETEEALKTFNQVIWADLQFSALFEIPSKSFYPLKPLKTPIDVDFENWLVPSLDVDFLAFGNLQVYETATVVEAYLFDVKTAQQVIGKRYTIADSSLIRQVAHQMADDLVSRLSANASQGVAQTKIAFSSTKSGHQEVYIMDYDGHNVRTVTANGGLNKFPEWSSDNTKLAFVTKLQNTNGWQLWVQDLAGGRAVLPTPSTYASSPSFSPDGNRIAYSSRSQSGVDSDVYVSSLDGSGRRNLTRNPAIDTSATWSPTGQQIAFISDRSATPQLWVMDSDGTNVQRLVTEGGHCDSPTWSPDGRFIAYSWQAPRQWKHDVYIVEVATGKILQLTSGRGSAEQPSWSPDGRHVTFQSTRSGTKQIFIMNADGKNLKQLTAYGINGSPSWSNYSTTEF
jgi:TolB protein